MDTSPNFTFLSQEFPLVAESASFAGQHVKGDPRAACFHVRRTMECLVKWLFRLDIKLKPLRVQNSNGDTSDKIAIELLYKCFIAEN